MHVIQLIAQAIVLVSLLCGTVFLLSSLGCALVVSCCSAQCSVDVPSSSLSRLPLPFGSTRTSLWSFTTGVPLVEESVLSFPVLASQFHGFRDGAGCCFLLFRRPTLCVVLAVFLNMILRDFSHSFPCSPSHVLHGHFGVWECVLVLHVITLTRMFAAPNCERLPWSPSRVCAWFFRCPLGLPPPWCVLFPCTRAPWSVTMSGHANHFIHTPGYTAFKEAYEQLSLPAVSLW